MKPSRLKGQVGAFLVLSALSVGCHPASVRISVQPDRWVCPGTPVTVRWTASQPPTIRRTPSASGPQQLDELSGSMPVTVNQTTMFRLRAGCWLTANETSADAVVYDPSVQSFPDNGRSKLQLAGLGSDVKCAKGTAWTAFIQNDDHWDPRLSIGLVRALGEKPLTVWHSGIRAEVTSASSDAFQGTSMLGIWVIEGVCDPGPPRGIGIELTASCQPLSH